MRVVELRWLNLPPRFIGLSYPVFIAAEIGQNHNGDVDTALDLVKTAHRVGIDAVKFQKRLPEVAVPQHQQLVMRETPWGAMTYLEYRRRLELDIAAFVQIDALCRQLPIMWFASPWDVPSAEFLMQFHPPCWKLGSPCLTDFSLIGHLCSTGLPIIASTGMSTMAEIDRAVNFIDERGNGLVLNHCNSTYPCPVEDLNLRMIETLRQEYPEIPIGYSGHEVGLATTLAAVALGACYIERHITLDRAMWGTDQAASVEVGGFQRLVKDIRNIEKAMGDGIKRVTAAEEANMYKLRRIEGAKHG